MMLLVVAYVVAQDIEPPIITGGLLCYRGLGFVWGGLKCLHAREDVVLGDEVRSAGMQTTRKEAGDDKVPKSAVAQSNEDEVIEAELCCEVDRVPSSELLGLDETWSQGVK